MQADFVPVGPIQGTLAMFSAIGQELGSYARTSILISLSLPIPSAARYDRMAMLFPPATASLRTTCL